MDGQVQSDHCYHQQEMRHAPAMKHPGCLIWSFLNVFHLKLGSWAQMPMALVSIIT